MGYRLKRNLLLALVLISCIVGYAVAKRIFHASTVPKPISAHNMPYRFYVVGFDKTNKPVLLMHEIALRESRQFYKSEAEFKRAQEQEWGHVLWKEDNHRGGLYSFYISKSKSKKIETVLTRAIGDPPQSVKIKISKDNLASKSQRVYIDYWNDDSTYYSVYSVSKDKVILLEYGDVLKRDGALALFTAIKYLLLVYLIGRVAVLVADRVMRRKKKYNCE